jgi:serine protease AprX
MGIVVVAAAGNTGYQRGHSAPGLANPAFNPFVIGVGATDTKGTLDSHDDIVAACSASSQGKGGAKNPDFVAPGAHLQGLRVPNSFLDAKYPNARRGERYFKGTGTSQAAAITSGVVALILQKYPTATPDMVKRFLKDNAKKVAGFDSQAQGEGMINMAPMLTKSPSKTTQSFNAATGRGTIEAARGRDHLSRDGIVLTGEKDIFGRPIDTASLAKAEATGSSWTDGTWNGSSWTGSSWTGSSWTGSSWTGSSWTGSSWTGSSWTGSSWTGSSWTASDWGGSSLSGSSWSGNSWATGSWD